MPDIDYEQIDFKDLPSLDTPLAARILNRMDGTIYNLVKYVNKTETFVLSSSNWVGSGDAQYPYKQIISSNKYDDSDVPLAQVWGTHNIETSDEITSISYVKKVIVSTSGVTVYASNRPTVDLKLVLKA